MLQTFFSFSLGLLLCDGLIDGMAEFSRVARLELECSGNLLLHIGEVDQDVDHVALLAVIAFITVTVNNVVLSVLDGHSDVVEVAHVGRVRKQVVPCDTLDGLLRHADLVKFLNNNLVSESELVLFLKVVSLLAEPVGVAEFERLEEVGQVFVDLDHVGGDNVAPPLESSTEEATHDYDNGESKSEEKHGCSLIEISERAPGVGACHFDRHSLNLIDSILKHLSV